VTSPTSPALPFICFTAARNLGSGITLLALLVTGQKKVVGLVLICGVVTVILDAWVCERYGGIQAKAWGHAGMGVFVELLGAGMWIVG